MSNGRTWKILLGSLLGSDLPIFFLAIFEIVAFAFILHFNHTVQKNKDKWISNPNIEFTVHGFRGLRWWNTFFVTIISLFPLLGMLGTVFGLLGLDLATGDMENIKNNFFIALTSTAWGVIFSLFFKFIYAFRVDSVEENLEFCKKMLEKNKREVVR